MRTPLTPPTKAVAVQKVTRSKTDVPDRETKGIVCHRCAKPGHLANICHFKDKVCHNCKKRGHIARACKSPAKHQRGPRTKRKGVHQVGEE